MATKLEMMQAVAKDCNRVLKMDPAIPTDLKTTEAMKKAILKEMDGELYDTDEENLKPETFAFLTNNLGIDVKEDPGQADAADPQDALKEKPPKERGKPPTKSKAVQAKQEEERATRKDAAEKGKETKEKKSGKKRLGVIASIREVLFKATSKNKAVSKQDILEVLIKRFPDREEKSLLSTIGVQIGRTSRETDCEIIKTPDKLYYSKKK